MFGLLTEIIPKEEVQLRIKVKRHISMIIFDMPVQIPLTEISLTEQ